VSSDSTTVGADVQDITTQIGFECLYTFCNKKCMHQEVSIAIEVIFPEKREN
jgi:hypothetical protein